MATKTYEPVEHLLIEDENEGSSEKVNPYSFLLTTSTLGTVNLYEATPDVPQALLRFHHLNDKSSNLVVKVIQNEVRKLPSNTLLLRESSMGSVMLIHLIEIEAHNYLQQALKTPLHEILKETESFEIESMLEKDAEKRIENQKKLASYAKLFLSSIINSLDEFPLNLRIILKGVAEVVHDKFPDMAPEEVIRCTVTAIVFLRFICPSLVAYKLKGVHATAGRRNLILVSKLLLSLAAGVQLTKEDWKPMNDFLDRNKEFIEKFCSDLIDVPSNLTDYKKVKKGKQQKQQKKNKKNKKDAVTHIKRMDGSTKVSKTEDLASIYSYLEKNKEQIEQSMDKSVRTIEKQISIKKNGGSGDNDDEIVEDPYVELLMKGLQVEDLTEFARVMTTIEDRGDPNFTFMPSSSSFSSNNSNEEDDEENTTKGIQRSGSGQLFSHLSEGASQLLDEVEDASSIEALEAEHNEKINKMEKQIKDKEEELRQASSSSSSSTKLNNKIDEDEKVNKLTRKRLKRELDKLNFALDQTKLELELKKKKTSRMRKLFRKNSFLNRNSSSSSKTTTTLKSVKSTENNASSKKIKKDKKNKSSSSSHLSSQSSSNLRNEKENEENKKKKKKSTVVVDCDDCKVADGEEEKLNGLGKELDSAAFQPSLKIEDFGSSLDWFNEERKNNRFTIMAYQKGLWCPLCRCYLKSWNEYLPMVNQLGGAVYGACAQEPAMIAKEAESHNIKAYCLSDVDMSLYTYYGGEYITPKETFKFFAEVIDNYGFPTKKMATPTVFAVDSEGNVLFSWRPVPNLGNFLGNRDRPHPKDVIRAIVKRLDEINYLDADS